MKEQLILQSNYGLEIYAHSLLSRYPDDRHISKLDEEWHIPVRNPFNNGRETLGFEYRNGRFCYFDTELQDFKGDPFDFAKACFEKEGEKLINTIKNRLKQRYDKEGKRTRGNELYRTDKQRAMDRNTVSFFYSPVCNTRPVKELGLLDIFRLIRGCDYKAKTDKLRAFADKGEARKFKANSFDYVTFAGTFSRRNDSCQLTDSGFMVIDFDHVPNLHLLRNQLLADEYFETELLFVSPSGDGLKWVIPVDFSNDPRALKFEAIANYIKHRYKACIDKSGKDASRACFLPHDPEAYVNPKYLTKWQEKISI